MNPEDGRLYIKCGRNYIAVDGSFGDQIQRLRNDLESAQKEIADLNRERCEALNNRDGVALERDDLANELYNTKRNLVRRMQTVANCRARGVFGYLDEINVRRLVAFITACKKWRLAHPCLYEAQP